MIKVVKERGIFIINILFFKFGVNEFIEFLKSIGGDVVVIEIYINIW